MLRFSDRKKIIIAACTAAVGIAIAIPIGVGVLPVSVVAVPIVLAGIVLGIAFLPMKEVDSIFR
jgi:biotin transporter BioY